MRTLASVSFILYFLCASAFAKDDCTAVIALSKISDSIVANSSEVRSNASNFCSEYEKFESGSESISAGASYKFLSGTFSSGSASLDEVASKYCSASNSGTASETAYASYINSIAPGAYDAYAACLSSSSPIRFLAGSVLPKEFSATVSNNTVGLGKATLRATPSKGVKCFWDNKDIATVEITSPGTATMRCERENSDEKSFVTLARSDGDEVINLPWQAYDASGNPYDALERLKGQLVGISNEIDTVKNDIFEKIDKRRLSCAVSEAQSPVGRNQSVEATIPENLRASYAITGGGCDIPSFYGHYPPITVNKPTASGWMCTANDPPNIPLALSVKAHVIYCKLED